MERERERELAKSEWLITHTELQSTEARSVITNPPDARLSIAGTNEPKERSTSQKDLCI